MPVLAIDGELLSAEDISIDCGRHCRAGRNVGAHIGGSS